MDPQIETSAIGTRTDPGTADVPTEVTYRLFDGDALFYFRDLGALADFISQLSEAGSITVRKVWIDTVQMSHTCWEGLPRIDANRI